MCRITPPPVWLSLSGLQSKQPRNWISLLCSSDVNHVPEMTMTSRFSVSTTVLSFDILFCCLQAIVYHSFGDSFASIFYNVKTLKYEDFLLSRRCLFISTSAGRLLIRLIRLRSSQTYILEPVSLLEFSSVRFLSSAEANVTFKIRLFCVILKSTLYLAL